MHRCTRPRERTQPVRLLAATDRGWSPATDPNDHVLPGELLLPAEQCDKPHCMCRREFVGVTTHSRTMQARVVELAISHEQLQAIAAGYVHDLWPELAGDDRDEEVDGYIHDLTGPASDLEVGMIVERWGYELRDIGDNTLPDDAEQDG
jgi:hypothetical protein